MKSKSNPAHKTWRENQKIKSEPKQQPKSENLIICPVCNEEYTDIFSHLKNPKRRARGHRIYLEKFEKYQIRPITEPLSSYPHGFKRRKDSGSYRVNFVFSCNRCKIRFCDAYYGCKCPICGGEPDTREEGKGEVEYRLTDAQIKAREHNLETAREVRSEEAEKSRVISFKRIPPKMQKTHSKVSSASH